ncbi:hypothetical protein FEM48_Zijuj07G0047500 [Ziziphus jujuba var. spinosa]|uniref:Cytochrome b6-f complex iron-sulfur subunit-like transmembrane anchor domain-containing protein n=1 Tax=Ziziphus jujuba var. spinosa TaxID=714518 RepID=A0A978V2I8_ZIZJJ|nr:hypothetical protein FEM48_Zijuj07G0047500 [Ziziphus jujuba var. spinosa]
MASSSATLSPRIPLQATTAPMVDRVPDIGKTQLMNLILLGTISLPTAGMVVPYASFFVPPGIVGLQVHMDRGNV